MTSEKITIGESTAFPLKGMLTLPDDLTEKVPAVVLVHGSGSSNMDEKVMALTPFRDIAEGLAARGIAAVRYDKRSFAHPFKLLRNKALTVREETIEDAILAVELLKKDARIDPARIFIAGHSMGGMLAPRIDAEGGNFAGLILLAGSPRKMEEILAEQTSEMLAEMKGLTRRIMEKQVKKLLSGFDGLYEMSDEEAKKKKYGGGVTMYYFKEMGEHDVPGYLAKTVKPMLILQGGKDFQVKADRDFARYKELLAGRDNVTFRLYENLNHVFVPSVYGKISMAKQEYSKKQAVCKEVIDDIASWIHSI